ncbi:hypothetical protein F4801DRAFT_593370 [Xylaria longipes]|nr:hypothetical protein F4801DRAFT_593370 [Xylaria longipes]
MRQHEPKRDWTPDILFFGPQFDASSDAALSVLQQSSEDHQSWMTDVISGLLTLWAKTSHRLSNSDLVPVQKHLAHLQSFLTQKVHGEPRGALPNTVLSPLTVLVQIRQYQVYVQTHSNPSLDAHSILLQDAKATPLGICIGLLTRCAIASAVSTRDLLHCAAVAIRLALFIGAIVDAEEYVNFHGPTIAFTAMWRHAEGERDLNRIISQYADNTYVSVRYDQYQVTVTASERVTSGLIQELERAGILVTPIRLRGRFHSNRHQEAFNALMCVCTDEPGLIFPDTQQTRIIVDHETNEPGRHVPLHESVLRSILLHKCDWYGAISEILRQQAGSRGNLSYISFDSSRCVPPSLAAAPDFDRISPHKDVSGLAPSHDADHDGGVISDSNRTPTSQGDCDVAIVGMSIKVAGADDLDEFSTIIRAGESQHGVVPVDRVRLGTSPWRRNNGDNTPWYGNFMHDVHSFDHKFFRKSPRECAAMDPQQRLVLQLAYQAVEQSGYFNEPVSSSSNRQIGVYVGTCATDYADNAACYEASAFTVMGLLRGPISGRVSHFFGWTGPSMTLDTACSGSAVAIHLAVQAILSGECCAALCGGVNVITNEVWFQNLAGASFLSPTGQCKPFDNEADGYCRGEGVGFVFLKPMASAIADGNQIFGRIVGTAVHQNHNVTPLFVPNAPSLSQLFRQVLRQAKLSPSDISVVEAHGTGTPVGDPAEYEAIRDALDGFDQRTQLSLGSVKGLVGHTESASGVVSLIKVIMMMHGSYIPPQASHSKINHRIRTSYANKIDIPTTIRPWQDQNKAALINNYGASGSNAALIVINAVPGVRYTSAKLPEGTPFPFWISGFDGRAIVSYCAKLVTLIQRSAHSLSLRDIAFNLNRQSNRTLPRALIFSCTTVSSLIEHLLPIPGSKSVAVSPVRPVILCFGGQTSTSLNLDRTLYDNVPLLRRHLNCCDELVRSFGIESIFPDLFNGKVIANPVHFQTMLFSLQYSCARCWMDCGVRVEAVVGHSFGELTALCVAGILNLQDTLRMIMRRAVIVGDLWGQDRGAMLMVDADEDLVRELLAESNRDSVDDSQASIACFNGPRSFTLAGPTEAIKRVSSALSTNPNYGSIRSKPLDVMNAFHSSLAQNLFPRLSEIGQDFDFQHSKIRFERATEKPSTNIPLTHTFLADHMIQPVFFHHAIRRLVKDYPSAIWLEAGSASAIISVVRRAAEPVEATHFQAVNISKNRGISGLSDSTISLWKEGLRVSFWLHHGAQEGSINKPLIMPPYQFEKTRHWLEYKIPATNQAGIGKCNRDEDISGGLWTFRGFRNKEKLHARFMVNTTSDRFVELFTNHSLAQTAPICPATLQYSMAIEALFSLENEIPGIKGQDLHPEICDMDNLVPLCINSDQSVWLDLEVSDTVSYRSWTWKIIATPAGHEPVESHIGPNNISVQGRLELRLSTEISDFTRYERLVTHAQCVSMLREESQSHDILQGHSVYRALATVVDYGKIYRGVSRVVGRTGECAGVVRFPVTPPTNDAKVGWINDIVVMDSFCQVAGVWMNCMMDRRGADNDIFLATGCERIIRSPLLPARGTRYRPECTWQVWAKHHAISERSFLTDVFVFDAGTGRISEMIMGIQYTRIARSSMSRLVSKLSNVRDPPNSDEPADTNRPKNKHPGKLASNISVARELQRLAANETLVAKVNLTDELKLVIANILGAPLNEISDDHALADLGIDSLVSMELTRELERTFHCKLPAAEVLLDAHTFRELAMLVAKYVNGSMHWPPSDDSVNFSSGSSGSHSSSVDRPVDDTSSSIIDGDTQYSAASTCPFQVLQLEVMAAFDSVKRSTDQRIRDYKVDHTDKVTIAQSTKLCVALVAETFERLGCSLRSATEGQSLTRISHQPQHDKLVNWIYDFLEKDARLIDRCGSQIFRTGISVGEQSSESILQSLLDDKDQWADAHRLVYYTCKSLADVLSGKKDGISVLFGAPTGRELIKALYCDLPFNRLFYEQIRDIICLLVDSAIYESNNPLRILELGAGTCGTTQVLAPCLASLNISVEYTVTDLSPSMVAQARRKFRTQYPFMRFAVVDMEKAPERHFFHTQHLVIASNAVHATADLPKSLANIRDMLTPDGVLLLAEMTETLPFVDLVFGLLQSWWRFSDGRTHAIVPVTHWNQCLQDAGFGYVNWTDGTMQENRIQRVIMALVSNPTGDDTQITPVDPNRDSSICEKNEDDLSMVIQSCKSYVTKYAAGFMSTAREHKKNSHDSSSTNDLFSDPENISGTIITITGATGSLGSHLVAHLAKNPSIDGIVILDRSFRSATPASQRQQDAFASRRITLSAEASSKLRYLSVDLTEPALGLSPTEYRSLVASSTHIIHNGWPMSANRPLESFEPQFGSMRRLLDLSADISSHQETLARPKRVVFQFVSSIGVVGLHSSPQSPRVPEEAVQAQSSLPVGYCQAKWVCEHLMEETLQRQPNRFRAMVIRPGQIAGSKTSGAWNSHEHFAFLIKSAQVLRIFPALDGTLQLIAVDVVAGAISDLALDERASDPVYHMDNPKGQPWSEMIPVFTEALDIPSSNVVPFAQWLRKVRRSPLSEKHNPALRVVDFLDRFFLHMSCGGIILDTTKAQSYSPTLAAEGPIPADLARKYIEWWREEGFLNA